MKRLESGIRGDRGSTGRRVLAYAAAAACLSVIIWMGLGWDAIRTRDNYFGKKGDYYSSQVHGFLSGHLYMDREADPRRASPDPAVRVKAPYLLDASYFKGRYYLYFGVTPAALVLLPYAWLTGGDLEPRFVVVLCVALGFLFSLGIARMAARDHLGRLGAWFQAASTLVLAFATAAPLLLTRAMFYEVPIATGYACTMAGAFWIYLALFRPRAPCLCLALASCSLGLAVGCRPDLVLNIPVLAAAAFLVAWWGRGTIPWQRAIIRTGAAAVIPTAFVGACLAAYNYERFGSPFEFGLNYSVNNFIGNHNHLFSTVYLWPNIHWYCLTFPALSPFFPYVFPEEAYFGPREYPGGEAIHGQFPVYVLAAFAAIPAILHRRRLGIGRLAAYLALLGWMFLAVFLAMCAIGVRADRYMADFQPQLALGIVLLAGAVASLPGSGIGQRLWRGAFALLAVLAAAFNIFAGLQEFDAFKNIRISTYRTLETLGNYPSYWLGKMGVLRSGPIELKVVFPSNLKVAAIEPLLTAGTPELSDSLYAIEWAAGKQIELMVDHHRYGGPRSDVIAVTPGQAYTFKIEMGALYPPLRHPFFAPYKAMQARLMKTGIHVEMDGKTVLEKEMNSYDAPPWSLEFGRNDVSMNPFKTRFTGRILSARRLAPPAPSATAESNGLWRIRCVFPLQSPNSSFPLLSAGVTGSGTLVYLNVLPENRIRFGVDEWSIGGGFSDVLEPTPQSEHVIEIYIGPLARRASWPNGWAISRDQLGRLGHDIRMWLDGHLVWTTTLHRPFDPLNSLIDVGENLQGFSTAPPDYLGPIQNDPYTSEEAREFLGRNLEEKP